MPNKASNRAERRRRWHERKTTLLVRLKLAGAPEDVIRYCREYPHNNGHIDEKVRGGEELNAAPVDS